MSPDDAVQAGDAFTAQACAAYPDIGDYAFIGDTRTGALVSRDGSIDWCCLPDFDSPSVFAALLDRMNGGRFRVGPDGDATVTRCYRDGAPVLETRFETQTGVLRLTDLMPMMANGHRRLEPDRQILRLLEVESGEVEVEVLFDPRPGYGQAPPRARPLGGTGWAYRRGRDGFFLLSDIPVEPAGDGLRGVVRLRAGERRSMAMIFADGSAAVLPPPAAAARQRDETIGWWRDWAGLLDYDGPYRDAVLRSAQVLRMLTFGHSGAVIAAPTTSLPEAPGGGMNWDYRYCWPRDAGFILQAFAGLGLRREMRPFMRWLLHATQMTRPDLATIYDLYGRAVPAERRVNRFEGWRGEGPVRIGNGAGDQLQLDIYGSVVRAVWHSLGDGESFQPDEKRTLRSFGEAVCRLWRRPDNGIWESRAARRHSTYGKAMCWCALDTLLEMGQRGILDVPEDRFRREAEAIRHHVLFDAWNPRVGAFTAAFGSEDLDAAVLTLPVLGLVEANDPRMRATFDALDAANGHGALMHRMTPPMGAPGTPEGAFGVCGFWAVEYLALRGDPDEARRRFEALLGHGNDLGLFAEETDPHSGAALGNFPQGLTHIGVINAALALKAAEAGRTA